MHLSSKLCTMQRRTSIHVLVGVRGRSQPLYVVDQSSGLFGHGGGLFGGARCFRRLRRVSWLANRLRCLLSESCRTSHAQAFVFSSIQNVARNGESEISYMGDGVLRKARVEANRTFFSKWSWRAKGQWVCAPDKLWQHQLPSPAKKVASKWTHWDLNPGPSACEANVMPLHHVPICQEKGREGLCIWGAGCKERCVEGGVFP